jgi:hypothetical protein
LGDISRDQVRKVGVEEVFAASRVGAGYCLGKASPDDPLGVFGAGDRGFVTRGSPSTWTLIGSNSPGTRWISSMTILPG